MGEVFKCQDRSDSGGVVNGVQTNRKHCFYYLKTPHSCAYGQDSFQFQVLGKARHLRVTVIGWKSLCCYFFRYLFSFPFYFFLILFIIQHIALSRRVQGLVLVVFVVVGRNPNPLSQSIVSRCVVKRCEVTTLHY